MNIRRLELKAFRNHQDAVFDFDKNHIIFYGSNGKGKTNILEAMALLSVGKSWREKNNEMLIKQGEDSALIELELENQDAYKMILTPEKKQCFKNQKSVTKKSLCGSVPTLLFCPEMMGLFSGERGDRLVFFDRFLVQINPLYRNLLIESQKAHKQKTSLLRSFDGLEVSKLKDQLATWNHILVQTVPQIIKIRQDLIMEFNPLLNTFFRHITGSDVSISLELGLAEPVCEKGDIEDFLQKNMDREIAARKNLISPSRDDFLFFYDQTPLVRKASRGETRSVLLSLLGAQKKLICNQFQIDPVLLLDDVFSELDAEKQKQVFMISEGSQTFYSSTHQSHFEGFDFPVQSFKID